MVGGVQRQSIFSSRLRSVQLSVYGATTANAYQHEDKAETQDGHSQENCRETKGRGSKLSQP